MRSLLALGLLALVLQVRAHNEEDFDDEAEVEEEEAIPGDHVIVEKVSLQCELDL